MNLLHFRLFIGEQLQWLRTKRQHKSNSTINRKYQLKQFGERNANYSTQMRILTLKSSGTRTQINYLLLTLYGGSLSKSISGNDFILPKWRRSGQRPRFLQPLGE